MDKAPTRQRSSVARPRGRRGRERAVNEESRIPETLGQYLTLTQLPCTSSSLFVK